MTRWVWTFLHDFATFCRCIYQAPRYHWSSLYSILMIPQSHSFLFWLQLANKILLAHSTGLLVDPCNIMYIVFSAVFCCNSWNLMIHFVGGVTPIIITCLGQRKSETNLDAKVQEFYNGDMSRWCYSMLGIVQTTGKNNQLPDITNLDFWLTWVSIECWASKVYSYPRRFRSSRSRSNLATLSSASVIASSHATNNSERASTFDRL